MKNENLTIVKIRFEQESKKGTSILEPRPFEVESNKIDEIAGTIAHKILGAVANLKRKNARILGFSFNRRFTLSLEVEGGERVHLSDLYANIDLRRTLNIKESKKIAGEISDSSKANMNAFADEIYDLVRLSMASEHKLVTTTSEVKEDIAGQKLLS